MLTTEALKRFKSDFSNYAKSESLTVEQVGACVYVFGSELSCLRIFAKYNSNGAVHNKSVRVGFSSNRDSFYFSLELQFSE